MAGDSGGRAAETGDDGHLHPLQNADARGERRDGRDDDRDVRVPAVALSCPCGKAVVSTRPSGARVCRECKGPVREIPPVQPRF